MSNSSASVEVPLTPEYPILIVDDEPAAVSGCSFTLESAGFDNTLECTDSTRVPAILAENPVSVVLLDLSMPGMSGQELLKLIASDYPDVPVVVVTGLNDIDTAVSCIREGAFDYMVKPVEEARLVSGVKRAVEVRDLRREASEFRDRVFSGRLANAKAFADIVTRDATMKSIFQYVETIAGTSRSMLITGETGVGKELVARALHKASGRRGEFVPVNVAGLDDNMFSDSLFGHVKGAFTGADSNREGLIARAAGGTLFLDEIGDLTHASQVKLLRLLQEREYLPLGTDVPRECDARIVAATNRDLARLRDEGAFRRDLYYRLRTHHVHVPPLRERPDDIPVLVDHFLEKAAAAMGKRKPTPPKELEELLSAYHFPGNVRELESMVFDAVTQHTSRVMSTAAFRQHVGTGLDEAAQARENHDEEVNPFRALDTLPTLKEAQAQLMQEAMRRASDNRRVAAELIGITRSGLSKALKRLEED